MKSTVSNPDISLVKLAHDLIRDKVKPGDHVIDATAGNGHDTKCLLDLVKPDGMVYGFEIQNAALNAVLERLNDSPWLTCMTLIQANHADMLNLIPKDYHGRIAAVMFNLGYLPGGDKAIMTQAKSTIAALSAASNLLKTEGIITVMAYPGHKGGETETDQVYDWCLGLDVSQYQVELIQNHPENKSSPKLFVVRRMD